MLEETVKDYAAYLNLDVSSGFGTVQDAIDNILTRLEELTSVLQMIKLKNSDCNAAVSEDINRYRTEITTLSKKVATVSEVILTLQNNVETLEKQVEKAEIDFGVSSDNKIKNFLKPFLMGNKSPRREGHGFLAPPSKIKYVSVMDNFKNV